MFIVVRRSNLILLVCIMLTSFYAFSLWLNRAEPAEEAIATFASPSSGRVIVIDAGHGALC
ncbi:MAG: hypothetical protein FWE04_02570 [Oscillospiraceae bacterium]|nr:hypothetical protein [Oscillospiraceae bacterium]